MVLNSQQFKFLKNCRNLNLKSSAKREYRDENVFLKGHKHFILGSIGAEFCHFSCYFKENNLLASLAHSHRALRAQLVRIIAPMARNLVVVALCAPIYLAEQYQNFYF